MLVCTMPNLNGGELAVLAGPVADAILGDGLQMHDRQRIARHGEGRLEAPALALLRRAAVIHEVDRCLASTADGGEPDVIHASRPTLMTVFVPLARLDRGLDFVAGLNLRALLRYPGDLERRRILVVLIELVVAHEHSIHDAFHRINLELIGLEAERGKAIVFVPQRFHTRVAQRCYEQRITDVPSHDCELNPWRITLSRGLLNGVLELSDRVRLDFCKLGIEHAVKCRPTGCVGECGDGYE